MENKEVEKKTEENKKEEKNIEETIKEEKVEEKKEEKKEVKEEKKEEKVAEKEKAIEVKKDKAIVIGKDLGMSTKQSVAICNFIRKRRIEEAVEDLEQVIEKRKAIPMKGEIPHRKGKGMTGGRYPVNACKIFIKLLKSLSANCNVNSLENPYIFIAKADIASKPHRRFGNGRFKRTNLYLEAREIKIKNQEAEGKK